jgi:hypothetical protein
MIIATHVINLSCPYCGGCDGVVRLGSRSLWCFCRLHRLKWIGGFDDDAVELDEEETFRRYRALGLGEYRYVDSSAGEVDAIAAGPPRARH